MRPFIRYALVFISFIAASVTTVAPALAATGPWVEEQPAPLADVVARVHATIAGHPGNWHSFEVDIDGNDDGVVGGVADWQCPDADTELTEACTLLGGFWDFFDDGRLVVTWSPALRYMKVVGPITLENEETGATMASQVNVRLRATGELTRTKSITHYNFPGDSWDTKVVDSSRDSVTFSGRVGWVQVTNSPSNTIWPIRVVRTFNRGLGDGV
jgi:hypothetical protein